MDVLLGWVMLHDELVRHHRKRKSNPLDDPLDRPEWQFLRWFWSIPRGL
ncbi:hypothetical protein C7477_10126 [Phyllobacterium leguminum]|uniref:Uncharacterized protein n=1 Tax=Phyllobacterium leguminum TaxID=314237 RepID=A0A318TAW9_9HYPH|nr:hypothetical protein C7477_10126 [Phyllobacterium leguminum]